LSVGVDRELLAQGELDEGLVVDICSAAR